MPPEKSRLDIEKLVRSKGAVKVGMFTDVHEAVVSFQTKDRLVKFTVSMPTLQDPGDAIRAQARKLRGAYSTNLQRCVEAEERRRWRALLLSIKAKFEVVDSKIETFDQAFLAQIVTPGGATVFEALRMMENERGQKLLSSPSGDGTNG